MLILILCSAISTRLEVRPKSTIVPSPASPPSLEKVLCVTRALERLKQEDSLAVKANLEYVIEFQAGLA